MQSMALQAKEERRRLEAAEGGRRQREGLAFPAPKDQEAAAGGGEQEQEQELELEQ